jgi:hypothetical protein
MITMAYFDSLSTCATWVLPIETPRSENCRLKISAITRQPASGDQAFSRMISARTLAVCAVRVSAESGRPRRAMVALRCNERRIDCQSIRRSNRMSIHAGRVRTGPQCRQVCTNLAGAVIKTLTGTHYAQVRTARRHGPDPCSLRRCHVWQTTISHNSFRLGAQTCARRPLGQEANYPLTISPPRSGSWPLRSGNVDGGALISAMRSLSAWMHSRCVKYADGAKSRRSPTRRRSPC